MANMQPLGALPPRPATPNLSAMATEIQRHILGYTFNDPSGLLGVFRASGSLSRVANEFLQAGRCLETSSEANRTALALAEYLFTSDGVVRQPSYGSITNDATTDRVMIMASMLTTLNIIRHPSRRHEVELHPLDDGTMAEFRGTINSFWPLSSYYKQAWCEALSRGEDRAILLLLLSVLRNLVTLNLQGSTHCLPLRRGLELTAGLSTIRTLELSAVTDRTLSDSCRYIMTLTTLRELIFSDMSVTQAKVRNIRAQTLLIVALRFLRCYATPAAVEAMARACMYLETFEYTVSGAQHFKFHDAHANNENLQMVDQLRSTAFSLRKIAIRSLDFVPKHDFLGMSRLITYGNLEYLDVCACHLLPDMLNGRRQTQSDYVVMISVMSAFLEMLVLRDCSWDKMLLVMNEFAWSKAFTFPQFTTLFISYKKLRTKNSAFLAELPRLIAFCRTVGIDVYAEVKKGYYEGFRS